jgi:hypothetical protein
MRLRDGSIRILDFGVARIADQTATVAGAVGTIAFMAPELFEGAKASVFSEIFSYGVTCYELLGGVRPFRGETEAGLYHQILQCRPEPLQTIPESLWELLSRMLARQPSKRLDGMHSVINGLAEQKTRCTITINALTADIERLLANGRFAEAEKTLGALQQLDQWSSAVGILRTKIEEARLRRATATEARTVEPTVIEQSKSRDTRAHTPVALWVRAEQHIITTSAAVLILLNAEFVHLVEYDGMLVFTLRNALLVFLSLLLLVLGLLRIIRTQRLSRQQFLVALSMIVAALLLGGWEGVPFVAGLRPIYAWIVEHSLTWFVLVTAIGIFIISRVISTTAAEDTPQTANTRKLVSQ